MDGRGLNGPNWQLTIKRAIDKVYEGERMTKFVKEEHNLDSMKDKGREKRRWERDVRERGGDCSEEEGDGGGDGERVHLLFIETEDLWRKEKRVDFLFFFFFIQI